MITRVQIGAQNGGATCEWLVDHEKGGKTECLRAIARDAFEAKQIASAKLGLPFVVRR